MKRNRERCLLGIFVLFSIPAFSQTLILEDSLDQSTIGRQFGGVFKDGAYWPGKGEHHILYKLPETVKEGILTFEIKGMSPQKIKQSEHGFACMYDGHKMAEPIQYHPEFKYNFYRFNFHWRKNRNAVKCVINIATQEKKEEAVDGKPMFDPNSGDMAWRTEPTGKGYPFQEDQWYRVRCEWRDNKMEVTIEELDGSNRQSVWQVKKSLPYDPLEHCIRLGSGPGKYSSALENIQFRNVKLFSVDTDVKVYEKRDGKTETEAEGT